MNKSINKNSKKQPFTANSQSRRPHSNTRNKVQRPIITPENRIIMRFNKPYGVLSQFTDNDGHPGLKEYILVENIYPCGRLDRDSEGLLILTNDGKLQHQLANPSKKTEKTYWAQVEGDITEAAITQLMLGLELKDGPTKPAKCRRLTQQESDNIWPRDPPIRQRANIPTSWIELKITEGRNRQVRRMTAAVGFPTLRLIRTQVGAYTLAGLEIGQYKIA